MGKNHSSQLRQGLVVSDLHLFSGRSRGASVFQSLDDRLRKADILVLNGDTFDFRWSDLPSEEETLRAAADWLEKLFESYPHLEIHYLLGNHDCLHSFQPILEKFEQSHSRFHLHEFQCRLGENLFVHGDCANWGMNAGRLKSFRKAWGNDRPKGGISKRIYRLVDAVGFSLLFHHVYFPRASTVKRCRRFLGDDLSGISACYFGHTHLPFENYEYQGVRYSNTGSGIRGMKFRPLCFQVS